MNHLAVIMDGNGRWGLEKGFDRMRGHHVAMRSVREVIDACDELNIQYLTLFAFSMENFKRNLSEVLGIFGVITQFIINILIPLIKSRGYRVRFIGDLSQLPDEVMEIISKANVAGLNNRGMMIIIAIAYSGTEELTKAFNILLEQKIINADYSPIKVGDIEQYLYTANIPNPDVILRFGGYQRLSNFLPYQSVYSELFFSNKYFPDCTKDDIFRVYDEYKQIKRNFGDVR